MLVTLRFLPLSSAFLPLFSSSAQVAGISSPTFCHQFTMAAEQGCLGLASFSPFSFTADSSILPTISSVSFPTSHTQIAPSPWASFYPPASRPTICHHCHRQTCSLGLFHISYHECCQVPCSVPCFLLCNPRMLWWPNTFSHRLDHTTCCSPAVPANPNLCLPSRLNLTAFPQSTLFCWASCCPYHFCATPAFLSHVLFSHMLLHLIDLWHEFSWYIHNGSPFQALS